MCARNNSTVLYAIWDRKRRRIVGLPNGPYVRFKRRQNWLNLPYYVLRKMASDTVTVRNEFIICSFILYSAYDAKTRPRQYEYCNHYRPCTCVISTRVGEINNGTSGNYVQLESACVPFVSISSGFVVVVVVVSTRESPPPVCSPFHAAGPKVFRIIARGRRARSRISKRDTWKTSGSSTSTRLRAGFNANFDSEHVWFSTRFSAYTT